MHIDDDGSTLITKTLWCIVFVFASAAAWSQNANLSTITVAGPVNVKSWKSMRDARITKQDKDYSCGAASLATILNGFYNQEVTEESLLNAMDHGDMRASFDDMARALSQFGFKGVGLAASFEQLVALKIPVVVYLKHRKDDHFSVVRGIDGDTVWLADPSLGNRRLSKTQFLAMWETREDAVLKGKLLAVLPLNSNVATSDNFFTKRPGRPAEAAARLQAIRSIP